MSKIQNVRLPNADANFSTEKFNQLVRSLEQVILQLNSTYTSVPDQGIAAQQVWMVGGSSAAGGFAGRVGGFQTSSGIVLPYGMVMDQSQQNNLSTTVENILTYDTPIFGNGVSVEAHEASFTGYIDDGAGGAGTILTVTAVSSGPILSGMTLTGTGITAGTRIIEQISGTAGSTGTYTVDTSQLVASTAIQGSRASQLKFDYHGQYLITVSCQVVNTDNAAHSFELWAKDTGVNYPLSNTRFDVPVRKSASIWGYVVANISGIFTVRDPASNYLEMAWWSDSTNVYVETDAAGTFPTRPAIPSVILTAAFLSKEYD
jgi:hypothetical protein